MPEFLTPPQMSRMPWYPRDFASATRDWPLVARAICRELLDAQWDMGSIPDDPIRLRSMVRCTRVEWRTAWRYVKPKFPVGDDGRRRNQRLEQHRQAALELSYKRRKSAEARWQQRPSVVPIRGE